MPNKESDSTTMPSTESDTTIDRRDLLRSATAAGVALTGLGQTASAEVTPTGKSVAFSEVKLTHELSLPQETSYHYPNWTVDDFSHHHLVKRDQSKLYLSADRDLGIDIPNQKAVVASDDYSTLPADLGGSSPSAITTGLHESFRVASSLSVKDNGYTQPQISVARTGDSLSVAAEGRETTVPVGTKEILTLPEREITVEVFEYTDEEPPEREDHRRAAPSRNYLDKKLTITPEVHAVNHGELDTVKVNTQTNVPHPPKSKD
jgi:hypothetical protein